MRWISLTFCVLFLGLALPLQAKVGASTLAQVTEASDVVVVARIEAMERRFVVFGARHARAKVLEVWKGTPGPEIRFLASPTWTCDISDAKVGETTVLFLVKEGSDYVLAHAGRGRMPIRELEGRPYATIWSDVRLPEGVKTLPGPEPEFDFIRSVAVEDLRSLCAAPAPRVTS